MGFDDGRVIFDRQDLTYFAGDVVRGQLAFHQDKVKTFRGIYLKVKGFCNVHWTSSHSRTVNGRTEHYTKQHNSNETYFEQKIYLIGSEHGEQHLNPGNHEFPFQCHIPPHCPSSYEDSNGHIRYQFKFVVDRSMKFDQEKTLNINLVARRDLNADPYCREPMNFDMRESYCCWCVSSGACEVKVGLPASGYCPGQVIPIEVTCENKSNVTVHSIKLELREETTFRATHEPDRRTEKNTIALIKKGPVPGNTTRNWTVEMEIPQMDVRNIDSCQYIDVDYEFHVKVCPDGCHESDSTSRRLVLGHVPLREFEDSGPPPELIANANQPNLQQYPGVTSPYTVNQPYPGVDPAYPAVSPYPGPNPPYSGGNQPYAGPNPPYPGGNQPYPGVSPYPGPNPPYPGVNPPYPNASPYPAPNAAPALGFNMPGSDERNGVKVPLLPGPGVPYPVSPVNNQYANASAPEPATPGLEDNPPAYNPEFYKDYKKPE